MTVTLEEDVAAEIERLRKVRRQPLKAIVNQALREGLKHVVAPHRQRAAFETGVIDAGQCKLGNVDDISGVLAVTENGACGG
jgi:predicted transcriptional regulator